MSADSKTRRLQMQGAQLMRASVTSSAIGVM
jgi:hypothetical protein